METCRKCNAPIDHTYVRVLTSKHKAVLVNGCRHERYPRYKYAVCSVNPKHITRNRKPEGYAWRPCPKCKLKQTNETLEKRRQHLAAKARVEQKTIPTFLQNTLDEYLERKFSTLMQRFDSMVQAMEAKMGGSAPSAPPSESSGVSDSPIAPLSRASTPPPSSRRFQSSQTLSDNLAQAHRRLMKIKTEASATPTARELAAEHQNRRSRPRRRRDREQPKRRTDIPRSKSISAKPGRLTLKNGLYVRE